MHGMRLIALCATLWLVWTAVRGYNAYWVTQGHLDSLANANVEKIPNVVRQLAALSSLDLCDPASRPGKAAGQR